MGERPTFLHPAGRVIDYARLEGREEAGESVEHLVEEAMEEGRGR